MFLIRKKRAHTRDVISDYKDELGNEAVIYEGKRIKDHPLVRLWQAFALLYPKTKISRS